MHHFIYPERDTFITNRDGFADKNFGIDEILQIGTTNKAVAYLSPTKDYFYTDVIFKGNPVQNFTGRFTGSIGGTIAFSNGTISGSTLIFSASYFSGSVDGVIIETSGSVSGSLVDGIMSGSVIAPYVSGLFTGQMTGAIGCLNGTGSGVDTRNEKNWTTTTSQYVDRTLLVFNIDRISSSIADGYITNPNFYLTLKVCNEQELPINYSIYAFPISQSWLMGNGYWSDGGSSTGVSWIYRDNDEGTQWYTHSVSGPRTAIDFINNPALLTASFGYGGGTWYTSSFSSQNFAYQAADIRMNVTPIVMQWLSGSIPNNGIILLSSDELRATGSGFTLKFFSRDTNTIYSPYLDVCWNDAVFITGSESTSSIQITTVGPWISSSISNGSTMDGGVSGSFSGSAVLTIYNNYLTASDVIFSNEFVQEFTGSLTGSFYGTASVNGTISGSRLNFYADYFSGSLEGTIIETSGVLTGSADAIVSGSVMSEGPFGLFTGTLTSSRVTIDGTGSGYYLDPDFRRFCGFTIGKGLTGNIIGVPVFGSACGMISTSQSLVTGSCGKKFYTYFATASFYDGPFSGSTFYAFYDENKFENARLFGPWTEAALLGASVNIPIPSGIDPYAYAYVLGTYIRGTALGTYTLSGSVSASVGSDSASFDGQFIDGPTLGAHLRLQLSGSMFTSSYSYTSSVQMTSSVFNNLDIERPFSLNLQSLQPQYRAGDVIKICIFGRKKYPQKFFGRSTQQEQYMIPEVLPTSSFFALKDNQTDEIVLNFDSYTQISCEYPLGNFFYLDTTGLPQERYYRVLIQVNDSKSSYTIDTGKTFKIVRGGSQASPAWPPQGVPEVLLIQL